MSLSRLISTFPDMSLSKCLVRYDHHYYGLESLGMVQRLECSTPRQIGGQMRMAVFGIDACVRDMSTTGLIVTYVKFCDEFVGFLNFCFLPNLRFGSAVN